VSTVISDERRAEVAAVLDAAARWGPSDKNIAAIGLAGSWARCTARDDSDVDLLVLADDPNAVLDDTGWREMFDAQLVRSEEFGLVIERRLRRPSGLEIEVGISSPAWAATEPVDPGTRRVVSDGFRILYERGSLLSQLVRAASSSPGPAVRLRPETEIEAGPTWTIAVNTNQNLLGKTMVILNRPCESVTELTTAEWSDLHTQLRRLRIALDNLFQPDQYNYAFLMNLDRQVHLHVVPRYRAPRTWANQHFDDPHWGEVFGSEQRPLPGEALQQLREAIRTVLRETA
jgi:diadenosine tetraphosphate (Ap4A) HIT family hydrolase/predicted nucleotidyltransferase